MPDPVIIPRAEHAISRRNIDVDALRVLYRLRDSGHAAYLVGGSVRDLLLGRRPKDFDIGTDAHPHQIKRLFRNCWIIGRRFRLAHIKFGTKTIEVATFRKNLPDAPADPTPDESVVVASSAPPGEPPPAEPSHASPVGEAAGSRRHRSEPGGLQHRDNTFGTPEEDAFRRDFTVNGLFYDIATFSVIDYVGGLADLEARVLRSIGDPRIRFVEDPVRMFRAAVFGARLGFDLDPHVIEAIAFHRTLILKASPARLIEEYYKILRSGYAETSFRALGRLRLLELITPELKQPPDAVWDALARLDAYRQRFPAAPPELTNALLIGALLMPLGAVARRPAEGSAAPDPRGDRVSFGVLPVARRDVEQLRHMAMITPRLTDPDLPPRVVRSLVHRPAFDDSLVWLEVFGDVADAPDVIARWRQARQQRHAGHHGPQGSQGSPEGVPGETDGASPPGQPTRRRRRRRRRRGRGQGPRPTE